MSTTADDGSAQTFPAPPTDDLSLLVSLGRGQQWLRMVLCTLARRGGYLRETDPLRARHMLDELSRSPLYRGGQFLFDLLELEDFMLDGDVPPSAATVLDDGALRQLGVALRRLRAAVDGTASGIADQVLDGEPSVDHERREDLAALDLACAHRPIAADLYLYADVAIGVVASLNPPTR
ncbi:hypothetical protein ACIA8G_21460 [Lentzea sp. NPDC051213]|uniref:hypothetical protein n=1 Tax=Lentzea sp. NPDC051213 TaxID=3364126 RepID=UPI00378A36DE